MISEITKFIFECLQLKRIKHEGWRIIGINNPDTVAAHSLSASQIAYILAQEEGGDPLKCSTIMVWHDIGETRLGDIHKIAGNYLQVKKEAEKRVYEDQFQDIDFGNDIRVLIDEYENGETLCKDADILEQAFQAKVFLQNGSEGAKEFIKNVGLRLQTETAKSLWKELQEQNCWSWAQGSHNIGVRKN